MAAAVLLEVHVRGALLGCSASTASEILHVILLSRMQTCSPGRQTWRWVLRQLRSASWERSRSGLLPAQLWRSRRMMSC